jgi:serine/threonine protein kinase
MTEEAIFGAALEKSDPAERAALLDRLCHGDAALRRRVEALLAAHTEPGGILDQPAAGLVPTEAHAPAGDNTARGARPIAEGPGTVIGPYKLLQQIGEGGMGAVFMAEQERPVRRRVALKVIKAGMDTAQVIARFEAERQALALMDHPNIARVLDAGATATGRPYFVMELVQGVPITRYADEARLTPRERLELLIPVCQAVQHAHQKGVIHRDIKPSNVLVTEVDGKPVPKVIDFGVAKATDQSLTERTLFTQFGAIVGTPEYMSPEQAGLGSIDTDTRSDIYSLGVLLYELLTGSTPLRRESLREAAFTEILRRIKEEEPPTPSSRLSTTVEALPSIAARRNVEPARLARLVRGELDWIVMKSLEKDRTRRYETANALARDIQRYLADEPVEAGPPSRAYRLRKFARKHGAALATAGAFATLLLVAAIVSAVLAVWAVRAERSARRSLARAQVAEAEAIKQRNTAVAQQQRAEQREQLAIDAVKRFADAVTSEPELKNNPALEALRKRLLKEPLGFFKALRGELQADRDTRPEALARLASATFDLAMLTNEIGDKQDALREFQDSLSIREPLARANPGVSKLRRDLAASYNCTGLLQNEMGHVREAIESINRALEIVERLARENPGVADYRRDVAAAYNNIGTLQRDTGHPGEALESHQKALAIHERLARENPNVAVFQSDMARSHNNIGALQGVTGRSFEALASYSKALEIESRLVRENPSVIEYQRTLALVHNNLGIRHLEMGHPDDALASYRNALEVRERLARENSSVTEFQSDVAKTHLDLGNVEAETGRLGDALDSYNRAREIFERLARANPTVTEFQRLLATTRHDIGRIHSMMGHSDQALEWYRKDLEIQERLARENPDVTEFQRDVGLAYNAIGVLMQETGRPREAMAAHEKALRVRERLARANPTFAQFQCDLAWTEHSLAFLLHHNGHTAEALRLLNEALGIHERLAREEPGVNAYQSDLGAILNDMAHVDKDQGLWYEARAKWRRAVVYQRAALRGEPRNPLYRRFLRNHLSGLADVEIRLGHPTEVVRAAREWATLVPVDAVDLYNIACYLARCAAMAEGPIAQDGSQIAGAAPEAYADEAMQYLKQAIDAGWSDWGHTAADPDLTPLHARRDFQELVLDAVFPARPFARP